MKNSFISVIIPTFNPNHRRLEKVVEGLLLQRLEQVNWEVIVVDNNSNNGVLNSLSFHSLPNLKIVTETKLGLTWARVRGILEARGDIIVMVDDDNVLDKNYLNQIKIHFDNNPRLGAVGGKSIGQYESSHFPVYFEDIKEMLAIRNLGEQELFFILEEGQSLTKYPTCSPIGAGMGIRKTALKGYLKEVQRGTRTITDRQGNKLSSGGDNDMVISIIKSGYGIMYSPNLVLHHIIPSVRLTRAYLARLNQDSSKSWVEILAKNGICPWTPIPNWTVPLRKIKSFFAIKPWQNDLQYIRWRGACGIFEGRSSIR